MRANIPVGRACLVVAMMAGVGPGREAAAETAPPPTITVNGQGEVTAPPDQVVIGMGAVAQANQADLAQNEVNQIVTRAISGITRAGVPADRIQTAGITLSPIYSGTTPAPTGGAPGAILREPQVVGYRAANMLRVRLDNLGLLGQVIDQAVAAGANQLQDVSFQLRDDRPYRQEALARATEAARAKARTIAKALGLELLGVRQVEETGVNLVGPQVRYREMTAMQPAAAATPVMPGEVRVTASVSVVYRVGPSPQSAATQP